MADWNTDDGRSFRKDRLLTVRPAASPAMMDERTFRTMYVRPQVVSRVEMTGVEEMNNLMFCPACAQPFGTDMVKARRLHISFGKDPLGNFEMLAILACKGCDFEEIVPVEVPKLSTMEYQLIARRTRMEMYQRAFSPGQSARGVEEAAKNIPAEMTFGQQLAFEVWDRVRRMRDKQEEARIAEAMLPAIEAWEANRAAQQQNQSAQAAQALRQSAKAHSLGQTYGSSSSLAASDAMGQYQQQLSQAMAKHVDSVMMAGVNKGMMAGVNKGVLSEENARELARQAMSSNDPNMITKVANAIREYRTSKK